MLQTCTTDTAHGARGWHGTELVLCWRVVTMAVHAGLTELSSPQYSSGLSEVLSAWDTFTLSNAPPHPGRTLCREKVLTQKVASSMVSSRVTWMKP